MLEILYIKFQMQSLLSIFSSQKHQINQLLKTSIWIIPSSNQLVCSSAQNQANLVRAHKLRLNASLGPDSETNNNANPTA